MFDSVLEVSVFQSAVPGGRSPAGVSFIKKLLRALGRFSVGSRGLSANACVCGVFSVQRVVCLVKVTFELGGKRKAGCGSLRRLAGTVVLTSFCGRRIANVFFLGDCCGGGSVS